MQHGIAEAFKDVMNGVFVFVPLCVCVCVCVNYVSRQRTDLQHRFAGVFKDAIRGVFVCVFVCVNYASRQRTDLQHMIAETFMDVMNGVFVCVCVCLCVCVECALWDLNMCMVAWQIFSMRSQGLGVFKYAIRGVFVCVCACLRLQACLKI